MLKLASVGAELVDAAEAWDAIVDTEDKSKPSSVATKNPMPKYMTGSVITHYSTIQSTTL